MADSAPPAARGPGAQRSEPFERDWAETAELEPQFRIPSFGELQGKRLFADLRVAWAPEGLVLTLEVTGKRQMPSCPRLRTYDSDGLHLFVDTRDTRTIHRASRYCHRFAFLPGGGGPRGDQPQAELLPIHRAKEEPRAVPSRLLQVRSRIRPNGYTLSAFVPERALTGYDPIEHPRLGFTYAVIDRELGWQTFTVGPEFPFVADPSLWGTLELHASD